MGPHLTSSNRSWVIWAIFPLSVWQRAMPTLIPLFRNSFLACAPVLSVGIPPTCHACGATEHNGGFHETRSNQCPVTGPRRKDNVSVFAVHQHSPTPRRDLPQNTSLGPHMSAIGESHAAKRRQSCAIRTTNCRWGRIWWPMIQS